MNAADVTGACTGGVACGACLEAMGLEREMAGLLGGLVAVLGTVLLSEGRQYLKAKVAARRKSPEDAPKP